MPTNLPAPRALAPPRPMTFGRLAAYLACIGLSLAFLRLAGLAIAGAAWAEGRARS